MVRIITVCQVCAYRSVQGYMGENAFDYRCGYEAVDGCRRCKNLNGFHLITLRWYHQFFWYIFYPIRLLSWL